MRTQHDLVYAPNHAAICEGSAGMVARTEPACSPGVGLHRAEDAAAFLADPVRSSIAGKTFVIWSQSRERIGAVHKGGYDASDASMLLSLFPLFGHRDLAPRYDILQDLSEVTSFEPAGFQFFDAFLRQWTDCLALRARRIVVIMPPGLPGAGFTGLFHTWLAPRFDAHLCDSRDDAYRCLGMTASEAKEIDAQHESLVGPTTLRLVREAIARQPVSPTISTVARQLGFGVRTLQRELAGLGTSFRDEVLQVRIATAKGRLLACNDKIECIARAVGFASTAAFSAAFHKVVGLAPTAFRARSTS